MHCDQFLVRIDAYVADDADDMDDAERRSFRSHLETCRTCREVAFASDPTLLFAAVPRREPDSARIDACAQAVSALIHQDRLEKKMRRRAPRWMMAAAAVLFLMIGIGAVWMGSPLSIDAGSELAIATEVPAPDVDPPQVEVDMSGEGVRVYQFAQKEDANTAVYFIVNSAMEL
jgi:hypothetical protein